jgi:hypothetical protein
MKTSCPAVISNYLISLKLREVNDVYLQIVSAAAIIRMCEGIVTDQRDIIYIILFWIVALISGGVFA